MQLFPVLDHPSRKVRLLPQSALSDLALKMIVLDTEDECRGQIQMITVF